MERVFRIKTEEEMLSFGFRLATAAKPLAEERGAFICLNGDLGAGKTVLVRGAAKALGVEDVTSPTFTIVHQYETEPPLYHFDVYRLSDGDELYAIGFEDYLGRGMLFMEWAELVEEVLPPERLEIAVRGSGLEERSLSLLPLGAAYEEIVNLL